MFFRASRLGAFVFPIGRLGSWEFWAFGLGSSGREVSQNFRGDLHVGVGGLGLWVEGVGLRV